MGLQGGKQLSLRCFRLVKAPMRPNPKPLPRRLLCGQFPVVAEDDGGGIAGFEGDLIGAFHDGDAVGNERVAQHVPRPRDAEGLREGGDFAVLTAGRNDTAAAVERSQSRGEIVRERDDAAGRIGGIGQIGRMGR